jgi:hypothetical protein
MPEKDGIFRKAQRMIGLQKNRIKHTTYVHEGTLTVGNSKYQIRVIIS